MKKTKHERLFLLLSIVIILLVFGIYQIYQVSLMKSKEEMNSFNGNLSSFCARALKNGIVNKNKSACEFPSETFNLAVKNGGLYFNDRLIIKDQSNLSTYEKMSYLEDIVIFNQKLGLRINLYAVSQEGKIYLLNTENGMYKGNYEVISNRIYFEEELKNECVENENQIVAAVHYYEYDGLIMSSRKNEKTLNAKEYLEKNGIALVCGENND